MSTNHYLMPVVSKTLDILELLQNETGAVAIRTIQERTRVSRSTAYRILKTLSHRGYLACTQDGMYRFIATPRKLRFGLLCRLEQSPFASSVIESLRTAADSIGIELVPLDHLLSSDIQPDALVDAALNLIIRFRTNEPVDLQLSEKIKAAGLPVIGVDVECPDAYFLGVNRYKIGVEIGKCLYDYAESVWDRQADSIVVLDMDEDHSSMSNLKIGIFEGSRFNPSGDSLTFLSGESNREVSHQQVRYYLNQHSGQKVFVVSANVESAIGACRAVRALGREEDVAIAVLCATPEIAQEMNTPNSAIVAIVSNGCDSYGSRLLELGMAILAGKQIGPYHYLKHQLSYRDPVGTV